MEKKNTGSITKWKRRKHHEVEKKEEGSRKHHEVETKAE